jgi:hypothetical protein
MAFKITDYADVESLDAEIAKKQSESAILKGDLAYAEADYKEADQFGELRGRRLTPDEISKYKEEYNRRKRAYDDNEAFLKEAAKPHKLKGRDVVKAETEAKDVRTRIEGGVTGESSRVKVTPESQIAAGAREMADRPAQDYGLWDVLSGKAPMGGVARKLQGFNPLALFTGPQQLAMSLLSGRLNDRTVADPMEAGAASLGGMSPRAAIDNPDDAADFAMRTRIDGSGTTQERGDRAIAEVNQRIARLRDAANQTVNRKAGGAYGEGVAMKVGQTASTAGMIYGAGKMTGLIGGKAESLGEKIGLGTQLSGPKFKKLMEQLEPSRVEMISGRTKALSEEREGLTKDVATSLANRLGADVEGRKVNDVWAVMTSLGMNSEGAKKFADQNKDKINTWTSKRDMASISDLNTTMNAASPEKTPVYLGKDGQGNLRFAVHSKKAGRQPSWVVAMLDGQKGKLSVINEENDLDQRPRESTAEAPYTLGDWMKLPGARDTYDEYQRKKAGSGAPEADF